LNLFKTTAALGAVLLVGAGCSEELPTSPDPGMIPVDARTVEVRLPFASFAENPRTYSGFGSTSDVGRGEIARDFDGVLNAHTLVRFGAFPRSVTVRDTAGVSRTDSVLTFPEGRIVVHFDTLSIRGEPPLDVSAAAILTPWQSRTATWEMAIDTLGGNEPWPTPGGGPVRAVAQAEWNPADGDSVVMAVDSATLVEWGDTTNLARGVRLSMETPDARVRVRTAALRLDTRPSVRPDTIVQTSTGSGSITFIYDPVPDPAEEVLRIGGVPATRAVFDLNFPEVLEGPEEVCEVVGCPFELKPESVIFASLVLQTAPTPRAFRPVQSLSLDVRPVLSPERLPRSPLGSSLLQAPRELPAAFFTEDGGGSIAIPMTSFVQAVISGTTNQGQATPRTLALLSAFEPESLDLATFAPPGSENEPYLRIVFTLTDGVTLP
jgi:hypothetical protein